ncbi:MAG: PH domain-containing protein [Methanobrevibacter sp.]|nr:PH domain-containing protein [Methanobrevibacter sp.]
MMFGKKDNQANDRIIYQAKPNMLLGCKKAIFGLILLILVLSVSGAIIQFVGEMQVYMISYVKLSLTRYTAIGVFVVILLIVVYIIWQIIGWYSKDYVLTESKIIVKSGILITRKNYMPYSTIQDINTSQGILSRLFNVGSVSVYSAYDNNQMVLENISNPSKVEDIIFSKMTQPRSYYQPNRQNFNNPGYQGSDYYQPSYQNRNDYYANQEYYQSPQQDIDNYYDDDDYVITPIRQEEQYSRRQYDYYPEDISYQEPQRNRYQYEPYEESLEHNINRALNNDYESANNYDDGNYYNEVSSNYSRSDEDYYYNNDDEYQYREYSRKDDESQKNDVDDSSETIIKRHFDKFKR